MVKDIIPVASTSFCMYAYQAAQVFSKKLRWTLYLEISSKAPIKVSEGEKSVVVEFLCN